MASIAIQVKLNKFPQAPGAMRKALGTAFAQAKGPILADMKRRTPVDTGELRDSESATSDDRSLTLTATAPHAIYVHQGTRRMSARPFMRDAIEASGPMITSAVENAVEGAL